MPTYPAEVNIRRLESRQDPSLECSFLFDPRGQSLHPGQRGLLLRRLTRRDSTLQANRRRDLLRESLRHWPLSSRPKRPHLHQRLWEPNRRYDKLLPAPPRNRQVRFLLDLRQIYKPRSRLTIPRQGILPWPKFWTSTKPFGTPIGPYFVQWTITLIMILAPPAGDAFNFGTKWVYPASSDRDI